MKKSKRKVTVTGGLLVLGALCLGAFACGSPNWRNQYTDTPYFTGAAEVSDGGGGGEEASQVDAPVWSALSASPSSTAVPIIIGDPNGNPDPVPWAEHPLLMQRKQ